MIVLIRIRVRRGGAFYSGRFKFGRYIARDTPLQLANTEYKQCTERQKTGDKQVLDAEALEVWKQALNFPQGVTFSLGANLSRLHHI